MYRISMASAILVAALGCSQATDATAPATPDGGAASAAGQTTVSISVPGMT